MKCEFCGEAKGMSQLIHVRIGSACFNCADQALRLLRAERQRNERHSGPAEFSKTDALRPENFYASSIAMTVDSSSHGYVIEAGAPEDRACDCGSPLCRYPGSLHCRRKP